MNRRELSIAMAAFAGFRSLTSEGQTASDEPRLAHSKIFAFDRLPATTGANGMISRPVLRGTLETGEYVEVHETQLPAGEMPHPPHRHTHSEFLLIRDGSLQVEKMASSSWSTPATSCSRPPLCCTA